MRRGTLILLLFIVLLAIGAAFVNFWPNPDSHGTAWHGVNNPFTIKQGLDLQGGVSVLLVPDPAQHYTQQEIASSIDTTLQQIENRVNARAKSMKEEGTLPDAYTPVIRTVAPAAAGPVLYFVFLLAKSLINGEWKVDDHPGD